MKEADMEALIARYPELFLEKGLKLMDRQYVLRNYRRPDLLFRDKKGRDVLVEIQCGALDEGHAMRMMDYMGGHMEAHPDKDVRLIFVAQYIAPSRKKFFDRYKIEYKEIPLDTFLQVAKQKKYKPDVKRHKAKNIQRAATAKKGLSIPEETDKINFNRLPNKPLFLETSADAVLDKFNDYMMKHVLKNKKQITIAQHSAWILAHKAGLHVTLAESGLVNADTQAYFADQTNRRIEAQMRVFYQKLMKQPYTRLKDIEVTLHGSIRSRMLTFKKIY
ncbi:MAG: DUF91 domain-containing protein [Calditrichaeota bacterium]|nr:MAG: DUF91 domain-containing protein [Calditrichota bacterium]